MLSTAKFTGFAVGVGIAVGTSVTVGIEINTCSSVGITVGITSSLDISGLLAPEQLSNNMTVIIHIKRPLTV